jgi:hypothetical protein
MTTQKLPPASAYTSTDAGRQRWEDYQQIREGKPPIHARPVTEAGDSAPASAPVPDVEIPPLHELRISDPAAFNELRRAFANEMFAHVDNRAPGSSPFNRSVGD